jgi:predicted methyltransferase
MNRKTDFYVYALGKFYSAHSKRLPADMLSIAVSKKIFIKVLQDASISKLSARMIYRHLEYMEKEKLIRYDNRKLVFTPKGKRYFLRIKNRFESYFNLGSVMSKKDIIAYSRKSQTHFKHAKK